MIHVDDFLVDRIFQPIADALARWASCYAIAAFFLTGFALVDTVTNVVLGHWMILLLFVTWMPFLLIECHTLQRKGLCDTMPYNRIRFRILRPFWFLLSAVSVPMAITAGTGESWFGALWIHDQWLLIVGMYFMACHMIPPRRQRQTVPRWVAALERT